jgi:hypothetical protein
MQLPLWTTFYPGSNKSASPTSFRPKADRLQLVKAQGKAVPRALASVRQTRTWNLMIDIAQSGNYPPGENDLANFVVQGEQRYWVHVAIDRFIGQVIDRQIELVIE